MPAEEGDNSGARVASGRRVVPSGRELRDHLVEAGQIIEIMVVEKSVARVRKAKGNTAHIIRDGLHDVYEEAAFRAGCDIERCPRCGKEQCP